MGVAARSRGGCRPLLCFYKRFDLDPDGSTQRKGSEPPHREAGAPIFNRHPKKNKGNRPLFFCPQQFHRQPRIL